MDRQVLREFSAEAERRRRCAGPLPRGIAAVTIDSISDLRDRLAPDHGRELLISATSFLILANLVVALAMFVHGMGRSFAPYSVQLAWGANFGPATKDGEWWRLATAMFLHFGPIHLAMNMLALWDVGRVMEKALGRVRLVVLYGCSGLTGNLLSLAVQGDKAVSGGASGAIFGLYGAMLVLLFLLRKQLAPADFRWRFWGAALFSVATLGLGVLIPGIDNAAHLGGLLSGALAGLVVVDRSRAEGALSPRSRAIALSGFGVGVLALFLNLPAPRYSWTEERLAREEIGEFIGEDARLNARLGALLSRHGANSGSFDQLAGRIEDEIALPYEKSFEQLSGLHVSPQIPSAGTLEKLRQYAEARRDASHALAEGLRDKDAKRIREALDATRKAAKGTAAPAAGGAK